MRRTALFTLLLAACGGSGGVSTTGAHGANGSGASGATGGNASATSGGNSSATAGNTSGTTASNTNGTGGSSGTSASSGTLSVTPNAAALSVSYPTPSTQQLTAMLTNASGSHAIGATWSTSRADIATVDGSGLVTASGPRGGVVTITASADGQTASATINIAVTQIVFSGAPSNAPSMFNSVPVSGSANAPAFLYPYDQTVIPVNLQPLDFQWQGGSGNDTYRLTLTGPLAELVAYVVPANPAQPSYTFDPSVWQPFAQSNTGQQIAVQLAATSSAAPGAVYGAPDQSLTLAASRFAGTIYYWTVSAPGQVLRINAGQTAPQNFYTPPFAPNSNDGPPTDNCMACHAVNHAGTRLSAELWNGFSPGSGTVVDLSANPATALLQGGSETWTFSTFSGDDAFLITSLSGAMTLRDANTGLPSPAGSGEGNLGAIGCGSGATCTQPTWAPDNHSMVFVQGVPGDFQSDVGFSTANLMSSTWDGMNFGAPQTLVSTNFDGQTLANLYPSISVDSSLLAFSRSSCTYDCDTNDGMFIVPLAGGNPVELSSAEGTDKRNRYPNFSPFQEGGYEWMAFFSMRPYGWVTPNTGPNGTPSANDVRQIWVTAIDPNSPTGIDPSHPAFWLPGQDPTTMNDKAEWATLPCVGAGEGCQGDIDCCNGNVCRDADGGSICLPASQACHETGDTCTTDADCCSPLTCQSGSCHPVFQ